MIMANNYPNSSIPGAAFEPPGSLLSMYSHDSEFVAPEFFMFNEQWIEENPAFSSFPADYTSQSSNHTASEVVCNSNGINNLTFYEETCNRASDKEKKEEKEKVAFKTKSEVEILDDGFKWRKYGKKMVKNSPNPRNYYRCSVEGCPVKKRVERDKEDSRYVVTTYEGIHNHQGPQPLLQ